MNHSLRIVLLWLAIVVIVTPTDAKGIEDEALDSVPKQSTRTDGYDTTSEVTERLSAMPLHSVEGLWRFAAEGTLMAIEREDGISDSADDAGTVTYRMVVVNAADMSLRPGTVMGYLTPTAKRGVYDARIYTGRDDDGTRLHSPRKFTLTLGDDDSRLSISNYGTSIRFDWWRLLPYMYRRLITRREKNPGNIDGCIRVYPTPAKPIEPRYL